MRIIRNRAFAAIVILTQFDYLVAGAESSRIFEFRIQEEGSLQPIDAEVIIFHNSDFEIYKRLRTVNGILRDSTEKHGWFVIEINSHEHLRHTDTLWITDDSEKVIRRQYRMKPVEVGHTFVFNEVRFYFNTAFVRQETSSALDSIAKFLLTNPSLIVEVAGHTDDEGPEEYNLTLSQIRAESIVKWLILKGVAPERLRAKGYGENTPIDMGITKAAKARNRRVEVKVLSVSGQDES